jgi:hypothetical protein
MSEFECSRGHLMRPSDGNTCKECGSRLALMDGKNDRQLRAEEEDFDKEIEEEREEEGEDPEECGQCDEPMSEHDDGDCPRKFRED